MLILMLSVLNYQFKPPEQRAAILTKQQLFVWFSNLIRVQRHADVRIWSAWK